MRKNIKTRYEVFENAATAFVVFRNLKGNYKEVEEVNLPRTSSTPFRKPKSFSAKMRIR